MQKNKTGWKKGRKPKTAVKSQQNTRQISSRRLRSRDLDTVVDTIDEVPVDAKYEEIKFTAEIVPNYETEATIEEQTIPEDDISSPPVSPDISNDGRETDEEYDAAGSDKGEGSTTKTKSKRTHKPKRKHPTQ